MGKDWFLNANTTKARWAASITPGPSAGVDGAARFAQFLSGRGPDAPRCWPTRLLHTTGQAGIVRVWVSCRMIGGAPDGGPFTSQGVAGQEVALGAAGTTGHGGGNAHYLSSFQAAILIQDSGVPNAKGQVG